MLARATMSSSTAEPTAQLCELELRAWRGMLRAHAALTKALDADLEAEHGIPLTSYEVLLHLAAAPEQRMRMSELADSVVLSRSGLTRLVDRMEREGLLARGSCPSDARGAFAILTGAGRDKLSAARGTHLAGVRALFLDRLSEHEQQVLAACWERVDSPGRELPAC